ncbi:hypothetical protein BTA51_23630 [Hahella sp. CCB-MM4]|uniref:methionyl-tRNA formyltransferase n=1 Tax=Hahella sp. (strain CCB-MM4) TaxID=1926491 RepID=UPI000BD19421|nr:formyltransferase family protein [Hahella sp. CCB-MM4]OZG70833.1 hypothetical protein BTA51_23630 [Hahella sp. CCB-MM4]
MNESRFLKFVVFTSSQIAAPLVSFLLQKNMLGGVVLAGTYSADEQHFAAELQKHQIPCACYPAKEPENLKDTLIRWEVNVGIAFAFGHIFPASLIEQLELGIFNLHPSPLPAYRGACPLFWQLKNAERESQLCVHRVTTKVDQGSVVTRVPFLIHPLDTYTSLINVVANTVPEAMSRFVETLSSAEIRLNEELTDPSMTVSNLSEPLAPHPSAKDLAIDWMRMTPEEIVDLTRAANGVTGGAILYLRQVPVGLIQATAMTVPIYGTQPGTVIHVGEPDGVLVACSDGAVRLDVLTTADGVFGGNVFANRFRVDAGMRFTVPEVQQPQSGEK